MLRSATIYDIPRIQEIINSHAELGKMLFKSLAQLYEAVRDFSVYQLEENGEATHGDGNNGEASATKIVGCCALTILWADLAEVRSLAVDDAYRGRGIGRALVEAAVEEARRLRIRKLMSLTYERSFFEKLGFEVVAKETLPLKVWSDCVRCPKQEACDEIAMVRILEDVPAVAAPLAAPTPQGVSIPVLDRFDEAED